MSNNPRKLTSVMDIHRQRFSEINQKYRQRSFANIPQPTRSFHMCPIIIPQASRPQPRQQARIKQQIQTQFPPTPSIRRSNTAHVRNQPPPPILPNHQYITLANLTKILDVLQTEKKSNDSDTATQSSASTTNSTKHRVQQHLQETATRWWKSSRSSDSRSIPSVIHTSVTSGALEQHFDDNNQSQRNLPLLTIVSNSTRQLNMPSTINNGNSKCDESDSSSEIQTSTVRTSFMSPSRTANVRHTRQEPLIMQARGMRVHSYDHHHYYTNHNNMNFFQHQRLIRQT